MSKGKEFKLRTAPFTTETKKRAGIDERRNFSFIWYVMKRLLCFENTLWSGTFKPNRLYVRPGKIYKWTTKKRLLGRNIHFGYCKFYSFYLKFYAVHYNWGFLNVVLALKPLLQKTFGCQQKTPECVQITLFFRNLHEHMDSIKLSSPTLQP